MHRVLCDQTVTNWGKKWESVGCLCAGGPQGDLQPGARGSPAVKRGETREHVAARDGEERSRHMPSLTPRGKVRGELGGGGGGGLRWRERLERVLCVAWRLFVYFSFLESVRDVVRGRGKMKDEGKFL